MPGKALEGKSLLFSLYSLHFPEVVALTQGPEVCALCQGRYFRRDKLEWNAYDTGGES